MDDNLIISVSRHQAMSELCDANDKNNDLEDNKKLATYHQSLGLVRSLLLCLFSLGASNCKANCAWNCSTDILKYVWNRP